MNSICLLFLGFFILYVGCNMGSPSKESLAEQKRINLENGIYATRKFTYAGGWNELSEVRDIRINITKSRLNIKVIPKFGDSQQAMQSMNIKYEDIKNISIKMQTEVEQNAGIGKILLIGIFAFAKKKKNLTFLVIDYIDEFKAEQNLVLLEEHECSEFIRELNKQRRKNIKSA